MILALLAAPLLSAFSTGGFAHSVLTNRLVAYYPFNGSADDLSGNARNGTVNGAVLTEDRFGLANQAYYFNGTDAYIEGSAASLPRSDRTISVWFRSEEGAGNGPMVLAYGGDSTGTSYLMAIDSSCTGGGLFNYSVWPHGGARNFAVPLTSREHGRWTHWVLTIEAGKVTSYIDGGQGVTEDVGFPDTVTFGKKFEIGAPIASNGGGVFLDSCVTLFRGSIDDLRVFDRALSASEVKVLNQIESRPLRSMSVRTVRVSVEATVAIGKCYQLQRSGALGEWLPVGEVRRATGMFLTQEVEVDSSAQFFRVLEVESCP